MRKYTETCIPSVSFSSAGAGGVVVGHKPNDPAPAPIAKALAAQRALVHRAHASARPAHTVRTTRTATGNRPAA